MEKVVAALLTRKKTTMPASATRANIRLRAPKIINGVLSKYEKKAKQSKKKNQVNIMVTIAIGDRIVFLTTLAHECKYSKVEA